MRRIIVSVSNARAPGYLSPITRVLVSSAKTPSGWATPSSVVEVELLLLLPLLELDRFVLAKRWAAFITRFLTFSRGSNPVPAKSWAASFCTALLGFRPLLTFSSLLLSFFFAFFFFLTSLSSRAPTGGISGGIAGPGSPIPSPLACPRIRKAASSSASSTAVPARFFVQASSPSALPFRPFRAWKKSSPLSMRPQSRSQMWTLKTGSRCPV